MVIAPGHSTTMRLQFMMHEGMDGPHDFRVHIPTNDPVEPVKEIAVLSDWGP
jgi:hypothetical protein